MTTGLLERPQAPRLRERAIPLTAEEIVMLDEAIERSHKAGPSHPLCVITLAACADIAEIVTGIGGGLAIDAAADEDFVDYSGDTVRIVGASLEQLLEARRRTVLKR